MSTKTRFLTVFVLLALCCAFSCIAGCSGEEEHSSGVKDYGLMPSISGKSFDGSQVSSSEFTDKVVIVDIWASWCPPCRSEIPEFIKLKNKYASKGLRIVGLSLDQDAIAHTECAKSLKLNYPSIIIDGGNSDMLRKIEDKIGKVSGIPTTLVADRRGHIIYVHTGAASAEDFEPVLAKCFK